MSEVGAFDSMIRIFRYEQMPREMFQLLYTDKGKKCIALYLQQIFEVYM